MDSIHTPHTCCKYPSCAPASICAFPTWQAPQAAAGAPGVQQQHPGQAGTGFGQHLHAQAPPLAPAAAGSGAGHGGQPVVPQLQQHAPAAAAPAGAGRAPVEFLLAGAGRVPVEFLEAAAAVEVCLKGSEGMSREQLLAAAQARLTRPVDRELLLRIISAGLSMSDFVEVGGLIKLPAAAATPARKAAAEQNAAEQNADAAGN